MTPLLPPFFSATAMSLSLWIFWRGRGAGGLPGCGAGSSCDAVTRSRWSRVGPVPVSLAGAILYGVLSTFSVVNNIDGATAAIGAVVIALAASAAAAAVWFFFLQLVVVRRFCVYCSAAHLCALVAAACLFHQVPVVGSTVLLSGVGTGLFAVSCLIVGQILIEPKLYAVIPTEMDGSRTVIADDFESTEFGGRAITLMNGRLRVDLASFPVLGDPESEHVLVWLFDFTCHECHHLHGLLRQAVGQSANQLAVIAVPSPIHLSDKGEFDPAKHQDHGSQLARIAFAIWKTDPEAYELWDQFMAAGTELRSFDQAVAKALELADIRHFESPDGIAFLDQMLVRAVKIADQAGNPKLPTLVLPGGMLTGRVPDLETLMSILEKNVFNAVPA